MRIIFLDRMTMGEDIITKEYFKNEDYYTEFELTSKEEVVARISDAEVIITNKVVIGKSEMDAAKNLKLICLAATGYNNIDIEEAKKRGIVVANVKNYSTDAVAQMVFTYILALYSSLRDYDQCAKNGVWGKSPFFTMLNFPVFELRDKTIGIIGNGKIGQKVAEIAKAFGMKIMVANRKNSEAINHNRVPFEEVIKKSDIITVHIPLNNDTKGMIGKKEFDVMKDNAIVINTARGGIVDEEALYDALKTKKIYGAGLDVLSVEPPKEGSKLFELDNIIITPHIAWASLESRKRLMDGIVENIEKFKQGRAEEIMV